MGIACEWCKGTGKVEPEIIEIDYDLKKPPQYSDSLCPSCEGTGVYHYSSDELNQIRLTKIELKLLNKCSEYYNSLDKLKDQAGHSYSTNDGLGDIYTGYDDEHDEDNPTINIEYPAEEDEFD